MILDTSSLSSDLITSRQHVDHSTSANVAFYLPLTAVCASRNSASPCQSSSATDPRMRPVSIALFATAAVAQTQYGENHVSVNRDSQLVEQSAFAAPNVTLYSPAFMPNASFDPGWFDGTEGPTSHTQMGTKSPIGSPIGAVLKLSLTHPQRSFSAASQRRIHHG